MSARSELRFWAKILGGTLLASGAVVVGTVLFIKGVLTSLQAFTLLSALSVVAGMLLIIFGVGLALGTTQFAIVGR